MAIGNGIEPFTTEAIELPTVIPTPVNEAFLIKLLLFMNEFIFCLN